MIGKVIGNYQMVSELAHGGMGVVYRGLDVDQLREVVIKEIPLAAFPVSTRVQLRARFRRETFVHAQLDHPGIVRLYDSFAKGDNYYLVAEYAPAMSLRELLMRQGLPTPAQALYLCRQALMALDFAHNFRYLDESDTTRLGVIHRDLKPSNLLVDGAGKLKLTDFGIVRMPDRQSMAPPSFQPGTVEYMPPEQLRGLDLDPRSDIFSLGVTFYEILTGQLPYVRRVTEPDGEWRRISYDFTPQPLNEIRQDISPQLSSILMRAIFRNPSERFQSASEFLKSIKEYERSQGIAESPSSLLTAKPAHQSQNNLARVEISSNPGAPATASASTNHSVPPAGTASQSLSENSSTGGRLAGKKNATHQPIELPTQVVTEANGHDYFVNWDLNSRRTHKKLFSTMAAVILAATSIAGYYLFLKDSRVEPASNSQSLSAPAVGDPVDSPAVIQPAASANPGNTSKLQEAREADRDGKFNQSVALYQEYLQTAPNTSEAQVVAAQLDKLKKFIAYLNAGRAAFNRQDYAAARRHYSQALRLRPYSRLAQNGLALSEARLNSNSRVEGDDGSSRPRRVNPPENRQD